MLAGPRVVVRHLVRPRHLDGAIAKSRGRREEEWWGFGRGGEV